MEDFEKIEKIIEKSIGALNESMDQRIGDLESKIEKNDSRVEKGFSKITDQLTSLESSYSQLESSHRQLEDRISFLDTKLDFFGLAARAGGGLPENGSGRFAPPGNAATQLKSEWRREKYYKR